MLFMAQENPVNFLEFLKSKKGSKKKKTNHQKLCSSVPKTEKIPNSKN